MTVHDSQHHTGDPAVGPPLEFLAHPAQRDGEAKAREIAASEVVQAAKEKAREYLAGTDLGQDPTNRGEIAGYVDELVFSQALGSLGDPYRPFIRWSAYPGCRYGLDNPDTIYRGTRLVDSAQYVITGRRNTSCTAFFQIMDQQPGSGGSLGSTAGFLNADDLHTDADGTFTLTVGPGEAPEPGGNHLRLEPGARNLLIRDTLADWATEVPMELAIKLVGEPTGDVPPVDELQQRCADGLVDHARFWYDFTKNWQSGPANTLVGPRPTVSGGLPTQVSAFGWFDLAPDEALVLTLDPANSPYVGFQLGTEWYISPNHWDRTSSLNNHQTRPNPDGSVTYVVSATDPGAWNWLDVMDRRRGILFVRWQGRTPGEPLPGPINTSVVPLAEVEAVLAELEAPPADAEQRAEQRRQRRTAYDRRPISNELVEPLG